MAAALASFRDAIFTVPLANPRDGILLCDLGNFLEAIFFLAVENFLAGIFAIQVAWNRDCEKQARHPASGELVAQAETQWEGIMWEGEYSTLDMGCVS